MIGRGIYVDRLNGREAAALVVNGRLEDLLIESNAPPPGTIYRAVADRPMKGQGGVFVKTPDGMGFLRQVSGIAPGAPILVQVTGYAEPGKAIPVSAKLMLKSRYVIVTPGAPGFNIARSIRDTDRADMLRAAIHEAQLSRPYGMILRSSCASADLDEIIADVADHQSLAQKILNDDGKGVELLYQGDGPAQCAWREWGAPDLIDNDEGSFERANLTEALFALGSAHCPLHETVDMWIEPTHACVCVDINANANAQGAMLRANILAAQDLPRQLRLRGLGGQIILDPAPMPKKARAQFETALRQAFRADDVETNLVGWTQMGLFELQRQRSRAPLGSMIKALMADY